MLLMAFYAVVPWVEINGVPALRFDIINNQISVAFSVFRFSDIKYLIFVFAALGIGLFFATSLRGRIWCGDYCPQTVFLEWLIRPIEEFIEGSFSKRKNADQKRMSLALIAKKSLKHIIFLVIASVLAHGFLGFFVSPYTLIQWIQEGPAQHKTAFLFTMGITAAFYIDFAYFREQFCSFLCPYARFQAIMIDADTPAIGYDHLRGEPRSKKVAAGSGDCISCNLCVRVCPTGIDIRQGNQLECIQCRRCEDACNSVMLNIKKPLGLIRMDSENRLNRAPAKKIRLRPIVYGAILFLVVSGLSISMLVRKEISLHVTRQQGAPYAALADGSFTNTFVFTFQNNSSKTIPLSLTLQDQEGKTYEAGEIICGRCNSSAAPYETVRAAVIVKLPASSSLRTLNILHKPSDQLTTLSFIRPE